MYEQRMQEGNHVVSCKDRGRGEGKTCLCLHSLHPLQTAGEAFVGSVHTGLHTNLEWLIWGIRGAMQGEHNAGWAWVLHQASDNNHSNHMSTNRDTDSVYESAYLEQFV